MTGSDPFVFIPPPVRIYLEREAPAIDGWLHVVNQWLLVIADGAQSRAGISGDLVEIGTWDGKTFCLLALLARGAERARGFDLQLRPGLIDNIGRLGLADRAVVREVDSAALDASDIVEPGAAGVRIFHVDGGHEEAQVRRDLGLAFATTRRDGIVILDDFFTPTLPGVTAAAFRCFDAGENRGFVPFLFAGQKCWFADPEHAAVYADAAMRTMPVQPLAAAGPLQSFLGGQVLVYDFT